MSARLFQDRYFYGENARAQEDAALIERQRLVREWIEAGPGRLSADEMMVLAWYREARARVEPAQYAADDLKGFGTAVDVLIVGNPGTVGVVNHQFDHIDGGLASCIHGVEVANGVEVNLHHGPLCAETPRQLIPFSAMANRLTASSIAFEGMVTPHRGLAALEGEAGK